MNELTEQLFLEFKQFCKIFERDSRAKMDNSPDMPTKSQAWILHFLYENKDKKIYQKDIEKHFDIRGATVTDILRALENKGYIIRQNDDSDKRLKNIVLTDMAVIHIQQKYKKMQQFKYDLLEGITIEEQQVLLNIVQKIKNNLKNSNNY